tara:strand:+ start:3683 stop:4570 length:888 start_codon:yes stop_codon:yes gene_type:complete
MSKLKTVWDAVNELRGDVNNSPARHRGDEGYVLYYRPESFYVTSSSGHTTTNGSHQYVSTITAFNALVEEMKANFGKCSHLDCAAYQLADKTLLEKETKPDYTSLEFWKDAPEGATHYKLSANSPSSSCWYMAKTNHFAMMYTGTWENTGWNSLDVVNNNVGKINVTFISRPQSTPTETPEEKEALDSIVNKPLVYTQEMVDNGVLPSVGMKIKLQYNQSSQPIECELLFISDQYMIAKKDNFEQHYHRGTWKPEPIDQRTKKEKAIDELMALSLNGGIEFKHLISKAYDEWVGE